MIMLKSSVQLDSLISKNIPAIIIFVSPDKLIPQESLLSFFHLYQLSKLCHDHIYIFDLIDENIYQKFQVQNFPQVVLLRGSNILLSFIGYNRQKSIQAINLLSQELGKGRFSKKLNIQKTTCFNKHRMVLVSQLNQKKYKNGCFYCVSCDTMSHVQKDKPILACFQCNQLHCYECSHQNTRI